MARKVAHTGLEREKGWLYYLDKQGNVSRSQMRQGGRKGRKVTQLVVACGVKREPQTLYFIDADGDVAATPMARR